MKFQLETPQDYSAVETVTREAFWNVYQPGCTEHLVLHQLRSAHAFIKELSYLAIENEQIIGHIAYSKMFVNDELLEDVICFGPISVLPEQQKKGVGRQLIQFTLQKAQELDFDAVLITGSPEYYQPLGFQPAQNLAVQLDGLAPEEEAPYFMAYELTPGYFAEHADCYSFAPEYSVTDEALEAFDRQFPNKEKRAPRSTDL